MSVFDVIGTIMFIFGIAAIIDMLVRKPKKPRSNSEIIFTVVCIGWFVVTVLSWLHK